MTTDSSTGLVASHALLGSAINHLAYVVDDLPQAVTFWTSTMGAGPFYLLDHVAFDYVTYLGEPAVFSHSAAFGQWGELVVELQQLHDLQPHGLRERLDRPMNHVAYVCADAAAVSAALDAEGLPMYLHAGFGPVEVRFHDVPQLGHSVELHQDSPFLQDFFDGLRRTAQNWDGRDPLRDSLPQDA